MSIQLDFCTSFKASHDQVKVSFICFWRLRPFFIRRLRDFKSCCCKCHMEMAEIVVGFNNMRSPRFHFPSTPESCSCKAVCCDTGDKAVQEGAVKCQAPVHVYKRTLELWEQSLCLRPNGSDWHALKCVTGQCGRCGFHLILLCDMEFDRGNQTQLQ